MIKEFHKCDCGNKAVWVYMPGYSGNANPFHCDDCIIDSENKIGCSCNWRYGKEQEGLPIDLPEGVELVWDSAGDYKSVKVSKSFIKEKLPELQKIDKDTAADVTRGTMEDYQKARQDKLNKLPDGSPLPNQKVQFNISRADIIKGKDIKVMEGGAAGVVYIDPETANADAAGVQEDAAVGLAAAKRALL
jgi:hypothetical protein